MDDNNNSKCITAFVKTIKNWKKEFQIPILLDVINKVLNICWFKILASDNLF